MNCSAISMTTARTVAVNGNSGSSNGVPTNGGGGGCAAEAAAAFNGNFVNFVNNMSTASTTPSTTSQSKKPELAAKIIKQSQIVCFDVDSTVIQEEGIDELANYCGKGAEVARVTKEAMGGGMTFQDALKIRLNIIRPTQQQIAEFIKFHPSKLTRNVKRFIEQLKADNKEVYLISGGFDCLIEPVARELNIPMTHVFANKLMFYFDGEYANFDTTQPTSKTGGKAEAISIIRRQHNNHVEGGADDDDATLITMIGDGATDLEAVPPANYFIGFGGNVVRGEVFKRAQYYVTDFEQLM